MDAMTLMMLVVLIAVFYFMIIRPENKRKKAAQELRSSLKKGDKLTTIGGIVGNIVQVNDETIIIETSEDRVRMEITKWAVSTTGVQGDPNAQPQKKKKGEASDEVPEEPAAPQIEETPAAPADNGEKKDWDPEIK